METKINVCDSVFVPAWVHGYGYDIKGVVTEIEPFMDRILVTVRYEEPDPEGRMGTVVYDGQVVLESEYADWVAKERDML